MVRSVPEVRAALRRGDLRLGTTDAYFLDRLAGTFATDVATASRTGLMRLDTCTWDEELCALFGVPIEALPEIRTTTAGFGEIAGTPVTAAIVDQQAALFGHGCRSAGDLKITLGTGAFLLAVAAARPAPGTLSGLLPTVAWDTGNGPIYAVDGGVYDVGSAIDWAVLPGTPVGSATSAASAASRRSSAASASSLRSPASPLRGGTATPGRSSAASATPARSPTSGRRCSRASR